MVILKYLVLHEAQIIVKDRKDEINSIAGTFKRTGDDERCVLETTIRRQKRK
jgi:hypothetical protein